MAREEVSVEKTQSNILSVEQLNFQIKQLIEGNLGTVWLRAEISNFKAHTSGHFYFSLKDEKAQITAVMFRGFNSRLKFKPADGVEVIVRGKISVYEPRGNYQIVCETMEPVGAGALQQAFEKLKLKLKSEGLFESARKRAIPAFPKHIAVVTSPTGAAIRDILNVLNRRARGVAVTVVPTIVQGAQAAPLICDALEKANSICDVDVIILARGGGSIEDMWCFNDENLARLISASRAPVISAVGHEIDFTIADFVSDLRAPTPSAAAELVAKSSSEVSSKVLQLSRMLALSMDRKIKLIEQRLSYLQRQLIDPQKKLNEFSQRNDDLISRLEFAITQRILNHRHRVKISAQALLSPDILIQQKRNLLERFNLSNRKNVVASIENGKHQVQRLSSMLDSLSPLRVVDRGYSMVTSGGQLIKEAAQLKIGNQISIKLSRGHVDAQVVSVQEEK